MLFLRDEFAQAWQGKDVFAQVAQLQGEEFRNVKSRRTLRFELAGKWYFAKIHGGTGWGEIGKDLLQLRKPVLGAENEWQAVAALTAIGIDTMTVAAYGKRGSNPATQESFIITESLENTVSLEEHCADWAKNRPAFKHKLALLRQIADSSRRMHRAGICHRDYYLCHFLLQRSPEAKAGSDQQPGLALIDLHRARIDPGLSSRWKIKDIAGLYFSAMDIGLTRTDLFRFMRIYADKPLAQVVRDEAGFWRKVERRAERLYRRIQGDSRTRLSAGRALIRPGQSSLTLPVRLYTSRQNYLDLQQVFRVMPGKRVVALATVGNEQVVAKIFSEPGRWRHHLRREKQGIEALQLAGIETAAIVDEGELSLLPGGHQPAGGLLLLQYLANSASLGQRWQDTASADERLRLLQQVLAIIARCHHQGLIQKDIHLNNFLLQQDRVFLLDAADIQKLPPTPAAADNICLDNLALFFAQFPVTADQQLPSLLACYLSCRKSLGGTVPADSDRESFSARVRHWRQRRWQLVRRKLGRETTAHRCSRQWNRLVIYRRTLEGSDFKQFLADPDAVMATGRMLKNGNSSTVMQIALDGRDYVVKRYNIKNVMHGLSRLLRPSRAWRSWHNAHMLEMLGVGTAAPVAMIERRIGPLRRQAWFLSEAVPGVDILQFLENTPINSTPWQTALIQFRALFMTLHDYRIVHGDMKGTNLMLQGDRLCVLDLDAMHQEFSPGRFRRAFKRDLDRFLANWKQQPEAAAAVGAMIDELMKLPEQASVDGGHNGGLKN